MTDDFAFVPRKVLLWQRVIAWGVFLFFLFSFRDDLKPAMRGFWNLAVIFWENGVHILNDSVRQQALSLVGFNSAMLSSMGKIALNVFIYIIIYFLSMFMVAQFALPIQGWNNRKSAYSRLFRYWLGWYGLTAFVREGKLTAETGEKESVNPGVVLVDLSSAVVLASQPWEEEKVSGIREARLVTHHHDISPLIRVIGPGVNFIEWGEKIKSVIDLRKQVRTTMGIKATTRDGIEVETGIFTVFSVGEPPEVIPVAYIGGRESQHLYALELTENKDNHTIKINRRIELEYQDREEIHDAVQTGNIGLQNLVSILPVLNKKITPYLFDPDRVFAAFSAGALNNSHLKSTTEWHELTQPICIDLFQSMLSGYSYDRLFSLNGLTKNYDSDEKYPADETEAENNPADETEAEDAEFLKIFKANLSFKMRCMGLISYKLVTLKPLDTEQPSGHIDWRDSMIDEDYFEKPENVGYSMSEPQPLTSSKVIRDHGIRVIAAGFTQIITPPDIRRQVVEAWKARSEREINITLAKHERDAMQVINNARTQVQRDNAYHLSNLFKEQKHSKEALALFLFQALENIATDPKSHGDLPPKEVLSMLQNLHRWLLIERKDMEIKSQKSSGYQGGGEKVEGLPKT